MTLLTIMCNVDSLYKYKNFFRYKYKSIYLLHFFSMVWNIFCMINFWTNEKKILIQIYHCSALDCASKQGQFSNLLWQCCAIFSMYLYSQKVKNRSLVGNQQNPKQNWAYCPIHVVSFTLISNLVTDYIQKRRRQPGLFSFEYNLSPK